MSKIKNDKNFCEKVDVNFIKCEKCSTNPTVKANSLEFCDECGEIFNNICDFLCLDINYKHLLLVAKIIKCLEELSHNDVLRIRAGIAQSNEEVPEDRLVVGNNDVFYVHGEKSNRAD